MLLFCTQCCILTVTLWMAKLPQRRGRGPLFTPQQEEAICAMVIANTAIRLGEIQTAIIADNSVSENTQSVSISTIDRVLRSHQMSMRQLYYVPFERNDDSEGTTVSLCAGKTALSI